MARVQQAVTDFFRAAGKECWSDFDSSPEHAGSMIQDAQTIATALLADVRTMFTFCIRCERFNDGHWRAMVESGVIRALLERLRMLREDA